MSVKYLYYTEDANTGGGLSAAYAVPLLDQILKMYGGERMCVHPTDADYKATSDEQYFSLAHAQSAYPDHTWIYLDHRADEYLENHPDDNAVYAVGHDLTGYDGTKNGLSYRLRTIIPDFEGHAMVCLAMACADRWIR